MSDIFSIYRVFDDVAHQELDMLSGPTFGGCHLPGLVSYEVLHLWVCICHSSCSQTRQEILL